jgi:hypothetical protein
MVAEDTANHTARYLRPSQEACSMFQAYDHDGCRKTAGNTRLAVQCVSDAHSAQWHTRYSPRRCQIGSPQKQETINAISAACMWPTMDDTMMLRCICSKSRCVSKAAFLPDFVFWTKSVSGSTHTGQYRCIMDIILFHHCRGPASVTPPLTSGSALGRAGTLPQHGPLQ